VKILHTSDWHLGRTLYERKRYDEYDSFLSWLTNFIQKEKIDILLVAGDIFDSSAPGNRAQEQYYGFLAGLRGTCCRHVIIIGGNHDSPSFLEAPKDILGALRIKVIGAISSETADEIYVAKNSEGRTEAIICAVPFLRDRDIRTVEPGESPEDKTRKLKEGIVNHYMKIRVEAEKLRGNDKSIPLIGMGHLFTSQGKTVEGDGIRELYIGTIVHIDGQDISEGFDYMALGHLHISQAAEGAEKVRYSGSPIPMSFAEAGQIKKVLVVEFSGSSAVITSHEIPCFQELEKISGSIEEITGKINTLKERGSASWIEIEVTSTSDPAEIRSRLDELIEDSPMEILRIKNRSIIAGALMPLTENETLETLDHRDVFKRCLEANEIPADQHEELLKTYDEAILSMQMAEKN
jgi:exonuclease SbcD